ncbi:MAG: sigma-54-dependent Fis family transcriptional regulator [Candidatus Aminicenantes bacterium]|nr:sigma-54-dependent Fis family transcriptional regulator [Candidatus Aminicenantes bacterium]
MKFKILIIDDEQSIRDIFSLLLEEKGYLVETAETGRDGLSQARKFLPDVILLDMNLPDTTGIEVLSKIKKSLPQTEVIIITAFGTIKNAIEATKMGAYDYLEKPVDNDELLLLISRALEVKRLLREVEELKSELSERYRFSNIIGTSSKMNSIFQMMEKIARVDGTVLITGESGTGKELVARAIHFNSPRKDGPFVVVNCGAIPRDLIESEFFGHTKGAFTDAKTEKTGKFELANKGTIFLDEVGELSPEAQVKLLRALGEKEIVKIGGTKTIPIDVRIIAATNQNLEEREKKGDFREDLYWRLAVLSLHLPPLREKKEDIPLLCGHLIQKYSQELNSEIKDITDQALEYMLHYSWPGNIRELENVIYEAMVLSDSFSVEEKNLPMRLKGSEAEKEGVLFESDRSLNEEIHSITEKIEKKLIKKALREAGGNKTNAAQKLGISRKTLFNKMTQHNIQ